MALRLFPAICILAATCGSVFLAASPVAAQDNPVAVTSYSTGVRAYLDGEHARAEQYLNRALRYGSSDPRVYYFRGLSKLGRNQPAAAESDIRAGALLEANSGESFGVGSTLRSVGGEGLKMINRIRGEMLGPDVRDRSSSGQRSVLRSNFRLPMEALATLQSPQQIAKLVEAARPSYDSQLAEQPKPTAIAEDPMTADPFVDDPMPADSKPEAESDSVFGEFDAFEAADEFADPDVSKEATEEVATEEVATEEVATQDSSGVPESARGSIKASGLLSVLGKAVGSLIPQAPAGLPGGMPGGMAPGMPSGPADGAEAFGGDMFDADGFEDGAFGDGGFDEGAFGNDAAEAGESPEAADDQPAPDDDAAMDADDFPF